MGRDVDESIVDIRAYAVKVGYVQDPPADYAIVANSDAWERYLAAMGPRIFHLPLGKPRGLSGGCFGACYYQQGCGGGPVS